MNISRLGGPGRAAPRGSTRFTISAAGPTSTAPHRKALDLEGQDLGRHVLGLIGGGSQPDATGLAPTADQHLGLDHDLAGRVRRVREVPDRGLAGLGWGAGDGPRGHWHTLGDEERLGVGFLDLHATGETSGEGSGRGLERTPIIAPASRAGIANPPSPAEGAGAHGRLARAATTSGPAEDGTSREPAGPGARLEWVHAHRVTPAPGDRTRGADLINAMPNARIG